MCDRCVIQLGSCLRLLWQNPLSLTAHIRSATAVIRAFKTRSHSLPKLPVSMQLTKITRHSSLNQQERWELVQRRYCMAWQSQQTWKHPSPKYTLNQCTTFRTASVSCVLDAASYSWLYVTCSCILYVVGYLSQSERVSYGPGIDLLYLHHRKEEA